MNETQTGWFQVKVPTMAEPCWFCLMPCEHEECGVVDACMSVDAIWLCATHMFVSDWYLAQTPKRKLDVVELYIAAHKLVPQIEREQMAARKRLEHWMQIDARVERMLLRAWPPESVFWVEVGEL